MSERLREGLRSCKAVINVKYRWIGITAMVIWALLIGVMVSLIGVGTYFAVFVTIILFNSFFTIDTCMTAKNVLFSIVPYILPIFGMISIIFYSTPDSLRLLTGMNPIEADTTILELQELVAGKWLLGFTPVAGKTAPDLSWLWFLPFYAVGLIGYVFTDASDRDGLKGIVAVITVLPIVIQLALGFTFGKSYGLLGSVGGINDVLSFLGDLATPIIVLCGSLVDYIIVSIIFGFEHAVPEEENL